MPLAKTSLAWFVRAVDRVCGAGAVLAAVCLAVLVGLTVAEMVARAVWGASLLITTEYGGYLLLAAVSLGSGAALRDGAMIRIDLLRRWLRPPGRRRLDLAVAAAAMGLCLFALWHGGRMALDHKTLGILADSTAETPLWLPQLAVPAGFGLLLLQLVATAIRAAQGEAEDEA